MAKTKKEIIINFLQSGDNIFCLDDEDDYELIKGADHYRIQAIAESNRTCVVITDQDFEDANISDSTIGLKGMLFEVQKVSAITPPVELLSHGDLYNIFESIADQCDGRVYEGYSGRCMYGKQCWGVSTPDPDKAIAAATEKGITNARRDSLGLDSIVYWPSIEYKKPLDTDETA